MKVEGYSGGDDVGGPLPSDRTMRRGQAWPKRESIWSVPQNAIIPFLGVFFSLCIAGSVILMSRAAAKDCAWPDCAILLVTYTSSLAITSAVIAMIIVEVGAWVIEIIIAVSWALSYFVLKPSRRFILKQFGR